MRVLIACEESQAVCIAFRERGHEAYSCDIQECSGGHPEWHIKYDVLKIIKSTEFLTQDNTLHIINGWDIMIAHPPCTYLSKAGARWLYRGGKIQQDRLNKGIQARDFFYKMLNAPIKRIAVENPQPMKIFDLPKHSTIIQPYEFGHPFSKKTYLWLKGLAPLMSTISIADYKPYLPSNTGGAKRGQKAIFRSISQKESSKTFPGIAKAMAEQWG
jgi:hypothetical protein